MAGAAQRGFSLVEMTVAVAIIALVAGSSVAFALASRPTALWAATTQFDSMLSATRSIGAAYGDGATIFVSASPGPANFRADLYAHRPSAAGASPMPSHVQPIVAQVAISESQILGAPPFAVIIHGNGDIGVRKGYSRGDPVTDAELPCPASNQLVFVFTVNGQTATRTLTCHTPLAYTGTTTRIPPADGGIGVQPTPWAAPSCDAAYHGCPIAPTAPATPPPCPAGTTSYNGVCRAPLLLTVTGPTATAGQCAWTLTLGGCAFTVSEQYFPFPNLFSAISTVASPCSANYSISSGSGSGSLAAPNLYTGSSPTTWTVTPQVLDGSSCTLVLYDDRGPTDPNGSATLQISTTASDPLTSPCADGAIGSPCSQSPAPLDCSQSGFTNPSCAVIVASQGWWCLDTSGAGCGGGQDTLQDTAYVTANGQAFDTCDCQGLPVGPLGIGGTPSDFACPPSSIQVVTNASAQITNGTVNYGAIPYPQLPSSASGGGYNYDNEGVTIYACPGWTQ